MVKSTSCNLNFLFNAKFDVNFSYFFDRLQNLVDNQDFVDLHKVIFLLVLHLVFIFKKYERKSSYLSASFTFSIFYNPTKRHIKKYINSSIFKEAIKERLLHIANITKQFLERNCIMCHGRQAAI